MLALAQHSFTLFWGPLANAIQTPYIIAGIVASILFFYLVYTLIYPEKF